MELDQLKTGIAETYQIVARLADMAGVFNDPQTIKALDWLANQNGMPDLLPYSPKQSSSP